MKKILTILFLLFSILSFAADRYWIGGGTNSNWNASPTTNWAATSGGTVRVAAPTTNDVVIFDGAGTNGNTASTGNISVTLTSLTFTSGYTATITWTAISITIASGGSFTDNTAHSHSGTGQSLVFNGGTETVTSGGKTWPGNLNIQGAATVTLSGNWSIGGNLTMATTGGTLNSGTGNLTVAGNVNIAAALTGSATITETGGTWSGAGTLSNSLTLAGNITVSGTVNYQTGTLTYTSGTITTTSSTLTLASTSTLNTNGISWNNVTISAGTQTINSLLTATGTLTCGASITFAGTAGFTCATFISNVSSASTYTFKHGVTYTITAAMNAFQSRTGSILTFTSDDATLTAAIVLQQGAVCSVLANFTRIDATGGRVINTFHGTLTTTTNIFSYTDYGVGGGSSCLFCN